MKRSVFFITLISVVFLATSCGENAAGTKKSENLPSGEASVVAKQSYFDITEKCPYGGIKIEVGIDENSNGELDADEVDKTEEVCNGAPGKNGADADMAANGVDGKDGADGLDGKDGENGVNGVDGKDGADGKNGVDGEDGAIGASGKDGANSLCATNSAPVINSISVTSSGDILIGTEFSVKINAVNQESEQTLTYSLSGFGAEITAGIAAGEYTFKAQFGGNFTFTAFVNDGCSLASRDFTFSVIGQYPSNSRFEIKTMGENFPATVIIDKNTNLMWQASYTENVSQSGAKSYCDNLIYAGFTDWNLPTLNEMRTIVNENKTNPASDFPYILSDTYWTNSWHSGQQGDAYYYTVSFYDGSEYPHAIANWYFARCMRYNNPTQ